MDYQNECIDFITSLHNNRCQRRIPIGLAVNELIEISIIVRMKS